MQNSQNKKVLQIGLFVLIAVVTLGIGYAAISSVNLIINGNATASVNQNNFKVHFTQAQAISGSTGASGTSTIDSQDDTKAMFDVTGLTKVGDYAEAVYTVRNDSNGIGAEITLNLNSSNTEYFKVTETILDNKLQAGEETTAKVKVEMIKTPITDSVTTNVTATLITVPLESAQAIGGSSISKVAGDPESFATDSWSTIQTAVRNNNTSAYNVGDTKTVIINGNNYTVRLVNKTINENCSSESYSETACGFVVEFADVVERRKMNSTSTNIGGWPGSGLYTYLQGTFFNNLPNDLKSVIKPTRVISGYGCASGWSYSAQICSNKDNSGNNFSSIDKLYLFSLVEVLGVNSNDTAAGTTHQLEYYVGNANRSTKQYQGKNNWYWSRTANYRDKDSFLIITTDGSWTNFSANSDTDSGRAGLVPAFRIG